MAQMTISLPGELKRYAEAKVEGGEYSTSSDYVRSLIRADKARAWDRLEKLLIEGLDSGDPIVDNAESRRALRESARQRLAEHKSAKVAKR